MPSVYTSENQVSNFENLDYYYSFSLVSFCINKKSHKFIDNWFIKQIQNQRQISKVNKYYIKLNDRSDIYCGLAGEW